MNCKYPYVQGKAAYKCGQCLPCRIDKRRVWAHRIILETKCHPDNSFVTLTYDDNNLPAGGSLDPTHPQKFLKRLRKAVPQKIRHFTVGEYGSLKERPHYHVALFNYPHCTRSRPCRTHYLDNPCNPCALLRDKWRLGTIDNARLEPDSASYIAGYTTKKMTNASDSYAQLFLKGRYPEFSRPSTRPKGIGYAYLHDLADKLIPHMDTLEDVPKTLVHAGKTYPLGPYLTRSLRTLVGRSPNAPLSVTQELEETVRPMYENTKGAPYQKEKMANLIYEENKGKVIRTELRHKLFNKEKTL